VTRQPIKNLAPAAAMKRSKALELPLNSEARARRFLSEKSWPNKTVFCVRCGSRRVYRLADKRYRCGECGYTFQEFAGRWIAELQIGAAQWLWTLKLFELELTPDRIAAEIDISHPTALKAVRVIRLAILQRYVNGRAGSADPYWHKLLNHSVQKQRRRARNGEEPVSFRVHERSGNIEIAPVGNLPAALLRNAKDGPVKLGPMFCMPGPGSHEALLFWGARYLPGSVRALSPARLPPAGGIVEDFIAFAARRLLQVRRLSRRQFPLYLMELKFRFEHQRRDLFELLAGLIAGRVPNR
jgi:transposase